MNQKRLTDLLRQWGKAEEENAKGKGVQEIIEEAEKDGLRDKTCTLYHITALLKMGAELVMINEKTSDGKYAHIVRRNNIFYIAKTLYPKEDPQNLTEQKDS